MNDSFIGYSAKARHLPKTSLPLCNTGPMDQAEFSAIQIGLPKPIQHVVIISKQKSTPAQHLQQTVLVLSKSAKTISQNCHLHFLRTSPTSNILLQSKVCQPEIQTAWQCLAS